MDRALRQLLLLRLRGGARHRARQLASRGGVLALVVVVAVTWLLLTTDWQAATDSGGPLGGSQRLRDNFADFMPFVLLAATVLTVLMSAGSPLHLSSQEINFLVAGPFSRRDILTYIIVVYTFGALTNAAIIAILAPPRGGLALATFAGTGLTLLFIQMASTTLILCASAIREKFALRWQPVAAMLVAALLLVLMSVAHSGSDSSLVEMLRRIRYHWIGEVSLAPFIVFVRIFLAHELWPEFLLWLSIGAGINAILIHAVFRLDRYSGEPSASRRSLFSSRSGRSKLRIRHATGVRWRVPVLCGIGPIVWRQMLHAYRGCDRVIWVWMAIALIAGPLIGLAASMDNVAAGLAIAFFMATYVLPKTLILDFRADLDSMEVYKTLPLKAWQIFSGQVIVVAVVASAIELALITGIWLAADQLGIWWYGAAALFILVFNLAFFALENLVFLVFPSRPVPVGRVDFEFMGRTFAEYFGKAVFMLSAVAAAGGVGLKVLATTNHSLALSLSAVWLLLFAFGLILIGLGGLAFRRFNVSETIS